MDRLLHDELNGVPILPRSELKPGAYYRGRCRNATIARWNGDEGRFYHWRQKFGKIFVETILHPDDEHEQWDVFGVVDEITAPTFKIPFDLHATFSGRVEDLDEFHAELWLGSNKWLEDSKRMQCAKELLE